MSALTVLYVILPFPLLFLLHDVEEIVMAKRWLEGHREKLLTHFPQFRPVILHLLKLDTLAFAIAAAEELLVLLAVTAMILIRWPFATWIWIGLFLAFTAHLFVHFAQVVLVRSYVPGIVTAVLALPYAGYTLFLLVHSFTWGQLLAAALAGIVFTLGNLLLSHKLGILLSNFLQR